jgi:hypothetical protein
MCPGLDPLLAHVADCSRMTGKPEVKSRPNSQLRGREVGFEEIAVPLLQARLWLVSGWPTTRKRFAVTRIEVSRGGDFQRKA